MSAPDAKVAQKPALTRIAGEFVHLSAARTGEFASSDAQLNRIHNLILAAIDSNLHSVITDCPHREKLGWLEQTHLLGNSLMYNYDLSQLYEKLADDMQDAQLANGLVPDIAPEFVQFEKGFRDSPEWGSAAILAVWTAYQQYGDQRILTDHYEMMKRYAEYLGSTAKGGIVSHGLGDWYDIGPGEPGESKLTGRGLTATAIYFQDLVTLEKVAAVLNKHEDAQNDARQANEVRAAFHAKLFHADKNEYDSGSQTANAMPLAVGLVDDSAKAAVLEHLVADIRKRENHVTAGDVGFHYVVTALLEGGRSSVLYDMISRNDNPSYGYQLQRGATTLTEAWDTNPSSSQNHFMLGHIEEWFHRGLAGVSINMAMARQRAEQIVIRPRIAGDVAWARDSQDSVLGKIASEWKRKGGTLALEVTIPVNARATIYVPVKTAGHVKENGRAIPQSTEIKKLGVAEETEIFEVGSGVYHFESDF